MHPHTHGECCCKSPNAKKEWNNNSIEWYKATPKETSQGNFFISIPSRMRLAGPTWNRVAISCLNAKGADAREARRSSATDGMERRPINTCAAVRIQANSALIEASNQSMCAGRPARPAKEKKK